MFGQAKTRSYRITPELSCHSTWAPRSLTKQELIMKSYPAQLSDQI